MSDADPADDDDAPPLLGSWGALYALVIGTLVAIVVLLFLLTRAFA